MTGFISAFDGQVCSLGYAAVDWIEQNCCHGPGDVQGEPVSIDDEMFDFLVDAYRIDPETGRRVWSECMLSRAKGRAKSEVAGFIVCFEAFGPCRFDRWDKDGQPVGRPVTSPMIRCLATEESQAGNTFQVVAYIVSDWGPENRPDIYSGVTGSRQYQSASSIYLPHGGEIRACTSGSASKDGGKETFAVADETHLYVLPELRSMYATVRRNTGKRKIAQPWLLQTTTAYCPGEESIAEQTLTLWRTDQLPPGILIDHKEAKGPVKVRDREHTLKQLHQVYGAARDWIDFDGIYEKMVDPRTCPDDATAARYYLNRPMSTNAAWIAKDIHERQTRDETVAPGEHITIGFDGSLNDDTTVVRGCRISDGFLFRIGAWPKPAGPEGMGWSVPRTEVLECIRQAFRTWDVVRAYCDPHEWRSDVDRLAEEFGEDHVIAWATTRATQMGSALDRLHTDLMNGTCWHDADILAAEHYGNVYVKMKGPYRLVRKENPNSARKIDSVVGDALAYEARADVLASGWSPEDELGGILCFT
jgi:phage terminase large subunit-like protein